MKNISLVLIGLCLVLGTIATAEDRDPYIGDDGTRCPYLGHQLIPVLQIGGYCKSGMWTLLGEAVSAYEPAYEAPVAQKNVATASSDPYASYRCGKNNKKVELCHKNRQTLCVTEAAARGYLKQKDYLGKCT